MKLVTLSKADKKTRADKEKIGEEIKQCVDNYKYTWVFGVENMRNTFLKTIRQDWKGSRIFFGRTRVMQKALGRTPEDEHRQNLHTLTNVMNGDVGMLMTDETPEVVKDYFESFVKRDYARAGLVAPLTFTLPAGIVYSRGGQISADEDVPIAHSLEATVRGLGVPTRLKNGKVELSNEHTVCTEGKVLNSKQTQLLKLFGIACSEFKINLLAYYDRDGEEVTSL